MLTQDALDDDSQLGLNAFPERPINRRVVFDRDDQLAGNRSQLLISEH